MPMAARECFREWKQWRVESERKLKLKWCCQRVECYTTCNYLFLSLNQAHFFSFIFVFVSDYSIFYKSREERLVDKKKKNREERFVWENIANIKSESNVEGNVMLLIGVEQLNDDCSYSPNDSTSVCFSSYVIVSTEIHAYGCLFLYCFSNYGQSVET